MFLQNLAAQGDRKMATSATLADRASMCVRARFSDTTRIEISDVNLILR